MDKPQTLDVTMLGPTLYCAFCSMSKVLSPCFSCQYSMEDFALYCRGCGHRKCNRMYEICSELETEKLFLEINSIRENKGIEANFCDYNLSKLPREIQYLTHLKMLDVSYNSLRALPKEIGYLTSLEILNLACNDLQMLPIEIEHLIHLEILDLSMNGLKELPKEIGYLTNLKDLYLEYNKLSELPREIKYLTNLKNLDISKNQLSKNAIKEFKKTLPNTKIYLDTVA